MKLGTLIVVLAAAGPAAAVPPAPPLPGDLAVAQAYIRSMRANDLRGYAGLFDSETKIAVDKTAMSPNEPAWTRILSGEFSNPSRKVEFAAARAGVQLFLDDDHEREVLERVDVSES